MKTIVVIDDEVIITEVLHEILEDAGYRVLTAHNGREGLALIEQERPDLVMSDLMMPELDGHELYHELQARPHHREILVVLLSAAARSRVPDRTSRYAAFVGKPFDLHTVLDVVERLIGPGDDG